MSRFGCDFCLWLFLDFFCLPLVLWCQLGKCVLCKFCSRKAVVLVSFLFCAALWRLLLGVPCWILTCSLFSCFSVLFSSVFTSPGDDKAGLYASRAFVCLSCMRYFLSFFCSCLDRGWLWLVIMALPGLFEIRKIAVCFLWLSLPGDYRVTDQALLAETT